MAISLRRRYAPNLDQTAINGSHRISKKAMMNESIGLRGIKGMMGGTLLATVILMPCLFFLQPYVTTHHVIAGIMTSALLGLILKACIPKGFPIPKDITTISSLGVSAFCFWVVIDGIVTGAIHDLPR